MPSGTIKVNDNATASTTKIGTKEIKVTDIKNKEYTVDKIEKSVEIAKSDSTGKEDKEEEEKKKNEFNKKFSIYVGEGKDFGQAKKLVSDVRKSNSEQEKNEIQHMISIKTVEGDNTATISPSELANDDWNVDAWGYRERDWDYVYNISVDYDRDGYINLITIECIKKESSDDNHNNGNSNPVAQNPSSDDDNGSGSGNSGSGDKKEESSSSAANEKKNESVKKLPYTGQSTTIIFIVLITIGVLVVSYMGYRKYRGIK